ncbi:MAG: phenylalanine--tRNA ligase subunit beta [Cyanobacteria bacterium J06554_11]
MRVSVNWLKELVEFDLSPEALAEALTMAGFEVEDIEDRQSWAEGVVVGRVLAREPHPNAEKLSVCTVDIGETEPSTIVCGAANVSADMCVPVATVGSYLPKVDLKIKPRELRGVPSAGMICSLAELGLARDSEGIHVFDEASFERGDIAVGQDVRPVLGLNDFVLDVTSTANRADALSMVGIAREISAITGNPLKMPVSDGFEGAQNTLNGVGITLTDPKACPIYIGSVLENIQIGPSPVWLQQRLIAAGTRAINNVVDVTNYVLLEWGQPLHAFDLDRLATAGGAQADGDALDISVRYAQADETLTTLDDQERGLAAQTLVITANEVPVALAGVMGGADTEVVDTTVRVFLEAAYFDAAAIRKSARSQGLRTEASARYERGVNPAELKLACDRALKLLIDTTGATLSGQGEDRTEIGQITPTRTVRLRLSRIHQILGAVVTDDGEGGSLDRSTVESLLRKLGCEATVDGAAAAAVAWDVTVPPYRYRDLEREIDLIEEVARLYGYDRFGRTLPAQTARGFLSEEAYLNRKLRAAFRGAGLTETIHYSLTSPTLDAQVVLANPLFREYSALRIDLIDGLIDAFKLNLDQGNGPLNGFEIGNVFNKPADDPEGAPIESTKVAGIVGGDARRGRWVTSNQETPMTWFEAKGLLQRVFDNLGLAVEYRSDDSDGRLHPGRTAALYVRGRMQLGKFGQLHPQLRQQRDLPEAVYVFEMDWAVLVTCLTGKSGKAVKFAPYSSYPASDRDLAFFAPLAVSVADLQRTMVKTGGKLLDSVTLFDEYRGENVPEGERSLAFRLVYRSSDRTLSDKDIDPVHQKIRAALEKAYKVRLRS